MHYEYTHRCSSCAHMSRLKHIDSNPVQHRSTRTKWWTPLVSRWGLSTSKQPFATPDKDWKNQCVQGVHWLMGTAIAGHHVLAQAPNLRYFCKHLPKWKPLIWHRNFWPHFEDSKTPRLQDGKERVPQVWFDLCLCSLVLLCLPDSLKWLALESHSEPYS